MYSARTIAKWFLAWSEAEEANDDLSNLKLQKLLYYAQGHYLVVPVTSSWVNPPPTPTGR